MSSQGPKSSKPTDKKDTLEPNLSSEVPEKTTPKTEVSSQGPNSSKPKDKKDTLEPNLSSEVPEKATPKTEVGSLEPMSTKPSGKEIIKPDLPTKSELQPVLEDPSHHEHAHDMNISVTIDVSDISKVGVTTVVGDDTLQIQTEVNIAYFIKPYRDPVHL